ncbi:hypothetical protein Dsin_016816 [Dipteronia sinensis]|uniref:AP2/ERF and B3 domain-containing transcription factor RAV1-like n=1 Tax=Dipteronia sinensis TaxID=43782 RepID=A0AAE0AF95_9ROSI|nr:hypothetical protein Dsin_016816 [Dipteronia sinensis]
MDMISGTDDDYSENAESRSKLPSSKYKGVVPQPNGRWGAQIYEKHQRVWLGTFNDQEEAAQVYDIAALRFRGQNAVTNLKTTNDQDYMEKLFLTSHSKDEIVDMLRKHTYEHELEQSKQYYAASICHMDLSGSNTINPSREFLFEKVVTPSDVGKLNRIVIPKQQAEKHFAMNPESASKGLLLNFEDELGTVWRLRYCYWSSSQSYVLTKGWSKFVKEKNLKAGDLVCFWRSINMVHAHHSKLHIDCKPGNGSDFEEMQSRVDLLDPVQTGSVLRLFGVNILEKPDKLYCT